jgi:hypothetical protein
MTGVTFNLRAARFLAPIVVGIVAVALMVPYAQADTVRTLNSANCGTQGSSACGTFTFVVDVHDNNDITFSITNATGGTTAYVGSFSIQLFSGADVGGNDPVLYTGGITGTPAATYDLFNNNKAANGGTCQDATHNGYVCVAITSGAQQGIAAGQTLTFDLGTITSSGSLLSTWQVMANGQLHADGSGGNVFALSTDASPTTPPSVPEPATFIMFGTGLVGVIGAARRRLL